MMKLKLERKAWFAAIILVVVLSMLTSCASAARPAENVAPLAPPMPAPVEKSVDQVGVMEAPPASEMGSGSSQDTSNNAIERLVIKTSNITIIVPDPNASMDRISRMAEAMGGYVVAANMYKQTVGNGIEVPRVSITIRVPSEKLNEALSMIRSESDQEPQNESLSSQDVTNEYVDLNSRLKNLEAAEAELTKIMQDAKRTEDVLSVYTQLVQIREQIEVIKGQIKYYEQSAALSSVDVELIADEAVQPIEIGGWRPVGVAKDAAEALLKTMQVFISTAIWFIVYILPVLLVLFVVFVLPPWLIYRSWRKRRMKKNLEQKPPESIST